MNPFQYSTEMIRGKTFAHRPWNVEIGPFNRNAAYFLHNGMWKQVIQTSLYRVIALSYTRVVLCIIWYLIYDLFVVFFLPLPFPVSSAYFQHLQQQHFQHTHTHTLTH